MNKVFASADEFFGRSREDYTAWLRGNQSEQLPFILKDLAELSREGIVLCDCHFTPEQLDAITTPSHAAFLLYDGYDIAEQYCSRPDHADFKGFIESAGDVAVAKERVNAVPGGIHAGLIREVRQGGYFTCCGTTAALWSRRRHLWRNILAFPGKRGVHKGSNPCIIKVEYPQADVK